MDRDTLMTTSSLVGNRPFMATDIGGPNRGFGPRISYAPPDGEAGVDGGGSDHEAAEQILSLLGDDDGAAEAGDTDAEGDSEEQDGAGDGADTEAEAEDIEASDDEADPPPANEKAKQPSLEAPNGWPAEAKEKFKALPPDLQQVVVERERDRERHFLTTQQEVSAAKKAAEERIAAVQQERQDFSQKLGLLIEMAQTMDPVLAEGSRTDWAALAKQNPAVCQAKWFEYQQRLAQVTQLAEYRKGIDARMTADEAQKAHEVLTERLDFWKDGEKRKTFQKELKSFLVNEGFSPAEVSAVTDARAVLLARKAMMYDRLMAQQTSIADKRKRPAPSKTLRSQASSDEGSSARAQALAKRAKATGRLDDQAAAILARL
jgi:hypothetical protein